MRVRARPYWLPKAGNSAEEYEDAFWPLGAVDREVRWFRCAVADGATEASFSGEWARMLVRAWCRGRFGRRQLSSALPALQNKWLAQVSAWPLPWYAEEKLRSGAFAALIGLFIVEGRTRHRKRWHALAVGDCCLFHLRDGALLASFPLTDTEQFSSRPVLLSSKPDGHVSMRQHVRIIGGTWYPGDIFYLMSDALARWFLGSAVARPQLEAAMASARRPEASFSAWVQALREGGCIRNDDVTLLRVDVG